MAERSGEAGDMPERETLLVSSHLLESVPFDIQTKLVVHAILCLADGSRVEVSALVDTGAEVNLVRQKSLAPRYFRESDKPKRFLTADQGVMQGGRDEVVCDFVLWGTNMFTGRTTKVVCPGNFYDANINVDIILSYAWLRQMNIDIRCRRHGLIVNHSLGPIWVAGVDCDLSNGCSTVNVNLVTENPLITDEAEFDACKKVDYTVRWPVVYEILQGLQIEPQRDCFATEGNHRFSKYWTKEEDAMSHEWLEGEILWVNPPWRLWPEVAQKLLSSKCEAVCVLPAWSKPWMQELLRAADRRLYFEAGCRIFETQGKPAPSTKWAVWALHIPPGPRKLQDKDRIFDSCIFVPRWRPMWAMGTVTDKPTDADISNVLADELYPQPEKWAFDLFSGTGSVSNELARLCFKVISLDNDARCQPTILCDIMAWDYRAAFKPGHFDVIFASPPCVEYSQAKTTAPRDLDKANALVQKTLEIIQYFQPRLWFLENPRHGLLKAQSFMDGLPFVDVDYCRFVDWGYQKPTRIWGSHHVRNLAPRLCNPSTCPLVVDRPDGTHGHWGHLGANHMKVTPREKGRIPAGLVRYLLGEPEPEDLWQICEVLGAMRLMPYPEIQFVDSPPKFGRAEIAQIARDLISSLGLEGAKAMVGSVGVAGHPIQGVNVDVLRQKLKADYTTSVFSPEAPRERPIRGPFGEATIELKPGATPLKQRPFHLQGERKEALTNWWII